MFFQVVVFWMKYILWKIINNTLFGKNSCQEVLNLS